MTTNRKIENLKPFKKGHDPRRNVKGAPTKPPCLTELMAETLGEEKDGMSAAKVIVLKQRQKAMQGDLKAAEWLFDRGYGRANQHTDIKVDGEITVFKVMLPDE